MNLATIKLDETATHTMVETSVPAGYKLTELGVIPEEWEVKTIKEIGTVGRGRVISHREIAASSIPQYPVYSSQTSNDGIMGYLDTFDFEGEYITWTTDGVNAGRVFHRTGRFNCTNVCGTIKVDKEVAEYVSLALGIRTRAYVSTNLANPKLMNGVVKQISIPLPPLPEQRAIAAALSEVDALIASQEQQIAKQRDLKTATMQQLLSGKQRLPGFSGNTGFKQTEVGLLPEDWVVTKLSAIADVKTGPFGSSLHESDYVEHGTPIITVEHLSEFGIRHENLPRVYGWPHCQDQKVTKIRWIEKQQQHQFSSKV